MTPLRVVVVGVGTEIGKTHVAVALVEAAARRGVPVAGLKPVESGVGAGPTDAKRLAAASLFHVKQPPYAFPEPVSPHLAAERAGQRIALPRIRRWVDAHPAELVVVETAGALLSPLGRRLTNLDLAVSLQPDRVILIASDRLGVLHDVRATLAPLRAALPETPVHLVLSAPRRADASTGTNAGELRRLQIAPAEHVFPRASLVSRETREVADALLTGIFARPRAPRR